VFLVVASAISQRAYKKVLINGVYTPERRTILKAYHRLSRLYWPIVSIVYLLVSVLGHSWDISWIIWPIAAILSRVIFNLVGAKPEPETPSQPQDTTQLRSQPRANSSQIPPTKLQ
jgi:hypothetical protein